jgi:GNAT superfamily N-acetyltransferase
MDSQIEGLLRRPESLGLQLVDILPDAEGWHAAAAYAATHAATALLVAGDMQLPLRHLARFSAALDHGEVMGVACAFRGFREPSVSVTADTPDIADGLVRRLAPSNGVLAVSVGQRLPEWSGLVDWDIDPWLVADCVETSQESTQHAREPDELARFYGEVDAPYWCPAMLQFGSRIIRDEFGQIAAAVSVLFVLPDASYAHIGGLVTAPPHRGQGFARRLLADVRSTLARAGIRKCGLFAGADRPWLVNLYQRFGFSPVGSFRFADLSKVNAVRVRSALSDEQQDV